VDLEIQYTDNGVLMPRDILHKETNTFSLHLLPEMWMSDDELWTQGKMYALAVSNDPLVHHHLGPDDPFRNYMHIGKMLRLYATNTEDVHDAKKFIDAYRRVGNTFVNCVFIMESTGDIVYFAGGGLIPQRENKVASGVYPKVGSNPTNKWQGRISHEDMPYMINPKSGYIVSTNNFMTSPNVKHGISMAFTFTGRKTAISELIEEAFHRTGNKVDVDDMKAI